MTHRAWLLVATAYAIGAVGLLIALIVVSRQNDKLEQQADRLTEAAGFYCMALQAPTSARETQLLALFAGGKTIPLSPLCEDVVGRLED